MVRRLVLPVWLLLLAVPAGADESRPLEVRVDAMARQLIKHGVTRGLVIGLVRHGKPPSVRSYGKTRDKGGRPDGRTVFEIGSVTKLFTGLLLADLVEAGKVALDDPVEKYLPKTVRVPRSGDARITLLDLATHYAGLPRNPSNLPRTVRNEANPFAGYTADQMYEFLSGCKLRHAPGKKFAYSNVGGGLLGHALARAAGKSYRALLLERICKPLGLTGTRVSPTRPMQQRRVMGYHESGFPTPAWDMGVLEPAGGLHSTVDDLAKFVAAHIAGAESRPLGSSIKRAITGVRERWTEDPFTSRRLKGQIGLGWNVYKGGLRFHSGQTIGCHCLIGFDASKKVGAVIVANTGVGLVSYVGLRLIEMLAGRPIEPLKVAPVVSVPAEQLARYEGTYRFDSFSLEISITEGRVIAQRIGKPYLYALYPSAPTIFFLKQSDAGLVFVKGESGGYDKLVLQRQDERLVGQRVKK